MKLTERNGKLIDQVTPGLHRRHVPFFWSRRIAVLKFCCYKNLRKFLFVAVLNGKKSPVTPLVFRSSQRRPLPDWLKTTKMVELQLTGYRQSSRLLSPHSTTPTSTPTPTRPPRLHPYVRHALFPREDVGGGVVECLKFRDLMPNFHRRR